MNFKDNPLETHVTNLGIKFGFHVHDEETLPQQENSGKKEIASKLLIFQLKDTGTSLEEKYCSIPSNVLGNLRSGLKFHAGQCYKTQANCHLMKALVWAVMGRKIKDKLSSESQTQALESVPEILVDWHNDLSCKGLYTSVHSDFERQLEVDDMDHLQDVALDVFHLYINCSNDVTALYWEAYLKSKGVKINQATDCNIIRKQILAECFVPVKKGKEDAPDKGLEKSLANIKSHHCLTEIIIKLYKSILHKNPPVGFRKLRAAVRTSLNKRQKVN